jgi:hypothetical protein
MQLIAFVNLKSKEGLLLRTFFRVKGGRVACYFPLYPMSMCVYYRCRGINLDQENANAMLSLLYAVPCCAAPRYASAIKSRRCV